MEQSVETIKQLLERYFDAETSDTEEQTLREFFRCGDVPAELHYARAMFGGLEGLAAETAPVIHPVRRKSVFRRWVAWSVPLAAAVVVGAFLLAGYLRQPYCYINGVAIYDADKAMEATVYFDRLGEFDRPVEMLDEILNQKE